MLFGFRVYCQLKKLFISPARSKEREIHRISDRMFHRHAVSSYIFDSHSVNDNLQCVMFDALVFKLCLKLFLCKYEMKCVLIQFPVTVLKILNIYIFMFICWFNYNELTSAQIHHRAHWSFFNIFLIRETREKNKNKYNKSVNSGWWNNCIDVNALRRVLSGLSFAFIFEFSRYYRVNCERRNALNYLLVK